MQNEQTQPKAADIKRGFSDGKPHETADQRKLAKCDRENMGNGQPDCPLPDGRTTAIFAPPRTDDGRCLQPAQDPIDEALMESFPCSDPPCYHGSHV